MDYYEENGYALWKCTNCGEEFHTKGNMEDEFVEHAYNCFDIMDFFKVIRKHGKGLKNNNQIR